MLPSNWNQNTNVLVKLFGLEMLSFSDFVNQDKVHFGLFMVHDNFEKQPNIHQLFPNPFGAAIG